MKRIVATLVVLICAVCTLGFQDFSQWIKYDAPEGRYSVRLPNKPTLGKQEAATPTGEKFTQFTAMSSEGDAVFLLGYFDLPTMNFSLDKARDGMVDAIHGKLISERPVTLAGQPGRSLVIDGKGDDGIEYLVQARLCVVDKRVYVLQFIIPKAADSVALVDKAVEYFGSFKIIEPAKATKAP